MLPYFPNCYQNKQCGQQSPRALGPRSAWCLEPHRQEWAVSLKEKIILLGHKRGVSHLHWFLHFSWQPSLWFSGISMTYSKECASPLAALLGSWPGVRGCAPSFVTLLSGVKPTLPPPASHERSSYSGHRCAPHLPNYVLFFLRVFPPATASFFLSVPFPFEISFWIFLSIHLLNRSSEEAHASPWLPLL